METTKLILTNTLCLHYNIEISFLNSLADFGLVKFEAKEDKVFIHEDAINDLEKIIRLHHDLDINLEGIDIVFNLLKKEAALKQEIASLKNRLRLYENL